MLRPCRACGQTMHCGPRSLPEPMCQACRRAKPSRLIWTKTCPTCGETFTRQRYREPTYCSLLCSNRRAVDLARPMVYARAGKRTCEVCSQPYKAHLPEQRTCSRACGVKITRRRERKRWPQSKVRIDPCVICGTLFAGRRSRTTWTCSQPCTSREWYLRTRGANACNQCGEPALPRRKLCDPCKLAALKVSRRLEKQRRKARERGVLSERYTLADIAARDRYQCGLCRKRVAMTKAVPYPKAPTIDHVVPLADGGDDTRANVQLAHFICNSHKSAGGSQQLALIG